MIFELVEAQRLPIEQLCRRYGVTRLWLFGSAATGQPSTSAQFPCRTRRFPCCTG
ncbi:MAG: hypothetical protein L6Q31_12150 [Fimbriimonadaceae bacterium]|nr:hypothetical protein [Fimbriimonadaceae bacterium]